MPIAHHVVLASGAVVAVSVAVATFIAIYESPELRQYADGVRRRIALAFYSIGDGITPPARQPVFNRPEDADGFFESRRGVGAEPGVDADDETRRRQREELLYWNSVRLQKEQEQEQEKRQQEQQNSSEAPPRPDKLPRRLTFDDFLQPDGTAEKGAYIFNSGADARDFGGLRRRGEGARAILSAYSNPFADEHHLDADEIQDAHIAHQLGPEPSEMSDIYSATTRDDHEERSATLEALSPSPMVDVPPLDALSLSPPPTLERELAEDEYMSAGQSDRQDCHATIQAWARESSRDFYSPLPVTPVAPMSEPDVISEGELTPTDSMSLAGSGEDIANDAQTFERDSNGRYMDVMSESEGMLTPASWSEVGSVISDNEGPMHA
ncbi:hypothetical protein M440DRAFT_1129221 [Trichoderma longibrachiatum ATCC 18648]|uniref:Transmembrane protein n=1 Tax=Trichoderma longibrachiatum ATCC 18648 TaxID=983965 RepID=A0A2T4CG89_TRILO|nr:hypothetical protein M440DRAFT_1129221 [Trichoderma longibrachiatum ATCC 18648]